MPTASTRKDRISVVAKLVLVAMDTIAHVNIHFYIRYQNIIYITPNLHKIYNSQTFHFCACYKYFFDRSKHFNNNSYVVAVCDQTCVNGGECLSPGSCRCRVGYVGASCEKDLNECQTNYHGCKNTSICVNMPGW